MILPARGYILIEILESELKTKAGVYLSQSAKEEEQLQYGKTVMIGRPDTKEGGIVLEPPAFEIQDEDGNPQKLLKLKRGDIILFRKHSQQELGYDDLAMLRFEQVLGLKIEEEK